MLKYAGYCIQTRIAIIRYKKAAHSLCCTNIIFSHHQKYFGKTSIFKIPAQIFVYTWLLMAPFTLPFLFLSSNIWLRRGHRAGWKGYNMQEARTKKTTTVYIQFQPRVIVMCIVHNTTEQHWKHLASLAWWFPLTYIFIFYLKIQISIQLNEF